MFERIQKNRGNVTRVLVICGSDHMERLAKRFYIAGEKVWAEDTYHAPWYLGRPMEGPEGVGGYDKERPDV